MKKVLLFSLLALGAVGVSTIGGRSMTSVKASNATYISGENVIYNGDFAIGPSEWKLTQKTVGTANWLNWNNNEATQVVTVDPTNEENTVLRFTTYENAGFSSMFILMSNIVAGDTYTISFDFLAPENCDNIGLAFWNITDNNRLPEVNIKWQQQLDEAGGVITDLENGWKNVTWQRTFQEGKVFDSAHIWCNVGTGSVYFDNMSATSSKADSELFVGGDFEGWLDAASATVPTEADENGIYGANATYVQGGVKLANGGFIAYTTALAEANYSLVTTHDGSAIDVEFLGTSVTDSLTTDVKENYIGSVTNATGVKFSNNTGADVVISNIDLRPIYESTYDPNATYYESETLTVNGDFEAFDVGTVFSDSQLEGAWGSVANYDNPARILDVDGSKAAVIGKHDANDSKTFSSMFLMTPEGLEIGDILRIKYDFKLTISDEADSYAEINSSLVGGANVPYYKVDLGVKSPTTTGAEKGHYNVKYENLENNWVRMTLDFEVSNDIIQWNSLRWLFTAHNVGDLLAIDNVNLYYLSTVPFTNPVTSITINQGDQVLTIGQTAQLTYTSNPTDHDETTFTWSSSNEAVATVSASGLVTAVAEGSAEITITAENGVKQSIIVTVTAPEAPKGGCGGSIIGASIIVSVSAMVAVAGLAISKKRKND